MVVFYGPQCSFSDFDLILFEFFIFLRSLDFTGLLSLSHSGLVIQVTHVVHIRLM